MYLRITRYLRLFTLIILCHMLWACGQAIPQQSTKEAWYGVDPIFQEFYKFLGKNATMGLPISPAFQEGPKTVQYLETGKMVFDPDAPIRHRFTLAPLCKQFDLSEPKLPPPPLNSSESYIEGHYIAPEFLPLYQRLLPENVGKPLTEVRYNEIYKRYEQFFENLAFYRSEDSNDVRLLAIGAWACGSDCQPSDMLNDAPIDIYHQKDPAFAPFINTIGSDLTGFALAHATYNQENQWEQVYEKVVLTTHSKNDTGDVSLRPLPKALNIKPEPPRPNHNTPGTYFYEIANGEGYEIPEFFWDYITSHGGLEITGKPITHYSPLNDTMYHQCFERLCLMYDPQLPPTARTHPEFLGYNYKLLYYAEHVETPTPVLATPTIIIQERFEVASSNQRQEISIDVLQATQPVAGAAPFITFTLPTGEQKTLAMPITDGNGHSNILLPPIRGMNSTLVPYQVCIPSFGGECCAVDSFVIWNTP